ncbi:MAG: CHRD domain-containing protein [Leptolyngbyaceae cyanobacterium CSU_1_4]|nr:CHRD domain-containing protein [Leptolyngbyaceae cyanobacterium CSU_1_4]
MAKNSQFANTQEGSGQLNGSQGRDKLVGGDGDDFLAPGDDTFRFRTARSGEEFPFATDSPGSTRLNLDLKGGVLRVNGTYKNFDGAPLFSQGETTIDPTAVILNGAQAQPFLDGFLKVPQDVEGNPITGTHLHFSPAGDVRGNFADATVVRYFNNTPTSAKGGTISGEFELTPQEQAALLAGNLYVNTHTNVDLDGDGKGGFLTGENRTNFNKNVVRFV